MKEINPSDSTERFDQPGKTRTWWHPLLARLLDDALATAYRVLEEVLVGKLPLRLDIPLIRREAGELSELGRQDLAILLPLLNRFTLIQFKGPTDVLQRGDWRNWSAARSCGTASSLNRSRRATFRWLSWPLRSTRQFVTSCNCWGAGSTNPNRGSSVWPGCHLRRGWWKPTSWPSGGNPSCRW